MIKRRPAVMAAIRHVDRFRWLASRAFRITKIDAAFLKAKSPKVFGDDLADLLARQPAAALDIVNQRVIAYQLYAHLGNLARQFGIDFVIDAGAHSGQFASTLYGYGGFKGEVHSFEPVKKYYDVLASYLHHYQGWKAYNAALGDVPGPSEIFVGKGHGGTSSLLPQTEALEKFAPDVVLGAPERILVRRVDEAFGDVLRDPKRRVMLKLDVQGFEERVLKSTGEFIPNLKLVVMELSGIPLYEGQCRLGEACSMMEELGFALIFTCNSFGRNQSVFIDYDFVFCRTTDLENLELVS
ncbi:MAG: FkbM family methyltransferase [Hyphomicrobium sp.]